MLRLTRNQVRSIDRRSIDEYHIPGVVLMENAARAVADAAGEMLQAYPAGPVIILCGGGNNGGDGLGAARHLHNRGMDIHIGLTADPAKYRDEALVNWRIVCAMNLSRFPFDEKIFPRLKPALIIDGIFGTGLDRTPRDPFAQIAGAVQETGCPILAIDIPSGLDCDTGEPLGPVIAALRTVTFVAEKAGFANPAAGPYLGRITVADIGCPRELVLEEGIK